MEREYQISAVLPNKTEREVGVLTLRIEEALKVDKRVVDYEIIVSDDPDGFGYGYTLTKGIESSQYPYILIMDADGTYNPSDIPRLIDNLAHSDMVIAERRGLIQSVGILKAIGREFIRRWAEWRTGFEIWDLNSGFRIFKRQLFQDFKTRFPSKFSFSSTLTLLALRYKYRVSYVTILYGRRRGLSSLVWKDFFKFLQVIEKCRPR